MNWEEPYKDVIASIIDDLARNAYHPKGPVVSSTAEVLPLEADQTSEQKSKPQTEDMMLLPDPRERLKMNPWELLAGQFEGETREEEAE